MKLNSDCIRDILLTVEEKSDFYHYVEYKKDKPVHKRLEKYTHDEIVYHINQCDLSELLIGVEHCDGSTVIFIRDLSPEGHEFLANIRQDNIWNGVKSVAKKVGSTSLSALVEISSNVISEIIKAQFGIGGVFPQLIP